MARFLFAIWEGGGLVPPTLHVVSKLVAAGHVVRVMSDECNREEAEATGARFIEWATAPSRPDKSRDSDPIKDWELQGLDGFVRIVDELLVDCAPRYAADLLAELKREAADLVVTSEMLCGVMAACESLRQPIAVQTATISLLPVPGIPPLGPGLTPARTDEERVRPRVSVTLNYAERAAT